MPEPAQPARRRDRLRRLIVDVEPLRRDRDFRYLWMGQVVSGLGRQVTSIVLPYQLYVLTGTPLAIGALALVQVVPIMAFSLGGGVVADAVDRRRLLLVTQAGLATASAALAGLAMMAAPPVLAIYAVAFVAAGLGAMDQPARSSAVPRLVPRERLPAALALGQLNFQAAGVVGPAIGGLVIASLGIAAGYAFDVITFAAAIGALLLIAPIPPAHGAVRPSLGAIAEGLRFARRRRAILGTFAVDLNAMVFGMPTALFPVLALDVFRVGPAGLGLLAAAPAAGALVGAVLTGWVGRVRRTGRAVLWASAGWGLAITAFGLCTFSFPLALVFLAAAGAADVVTAVLRSAIVQLLTPDELRGRVTSIHILVVTGGPRLGDVEASAVASLAGAQLSVVSGGLLCLVGLVAIVRSFPELAAFDMWEVTALAATEPEPGPAPTA
jgi:MFS family permease